MPRVSLPRVSLPRVSLPRVSLACIVFARSRLAHIGFVHIQAYAWLCSVAPHDDPCTGKSKADEPLTPGKDPLARVVAIAHGNTAKRRTPARCSLKR